MVTITNGYYAATLSLVFAPSKSERGREVQLDDVPRRRIHGGCAGCGDASTVDASPRIIILAHPCLLRLHVKVDGHVSYDYM